MRSKNELFMDAIQFLIDNGKADNQGDVAVKAGLGPNLISRVKNGRVNNVSDDAIRALCSAFPDLNIDYLRGKSDYISRQQLMDMRADAAIKEAQALLDANPPHEPRQRSSMDESFIYEKAIKKIYDEISGQFIENLKLQVEDQRRTISHLEKEIDDKNNTIKNLQSRISELEMYINSHSVGNALEKYPFPISVAEDGSLRILMTK